MCRILTIVLDMVTRSAKRRMDWGANAFEINACTKSYRFSVDCRSGQAIIDHFTLWNYIVLLGLLDCSGFC